jgi:glycerol-3-phosphate acyltransferase PlsY
MDTQAWLLLAGAYLVGSIPTAYILGRLFRGIDIREYGSGNVGATNALRVLGKKLGITCLILDMIKGAAPVLAAKYMLDPADPKTQWVAAGCGLLAIVGHIYTIFLRFQGGKGVASTLGVFLALEPLAVFCAALVGVILIAVDRRVALGSLTIATLIPTFTALRGAFAPEGWRPEHFPWPNIALGIMLAAMIFWAHRSNIKRLLKGEEGRLGDVDPEEGPDRKRLNPRPRV